MFVKNFLVNYSIRLAMYNKCVNSKLISVVKTRFASTVVMVKNFKLTKYGLLEMVISEEWDSYHDDDVGKSATCERNNLNDIRRDKIDTILSFTNLIYVMLHKADTYRHTLHLTYNMWDTMIKNVRASTYRLEGNELSEYSSFNSVIYQILVNRWNKSNTPL